jgi:hypothetical protein
MGRETAVFAPLGDGCVVCVKNVCSHRRYGVKGAALPCGGVGATPPESLSGRIHDAQD